jgi:hypothetical protein
MCDEDLPTVTKTTTISGFDVSVPPYTDIFSNNFLVYPIQLRYKATSTPLATSHTSSSTLGTSLSDAITENTVYSTSTGNVQSSSTAALASSSSGLATGSKAAIGVVIPVVVIAAVALAFFLLRRHRRSALATSGSTSNPGHAQAGLMVAGHDDTGKDTYAKPELHGTTSARAPEATLHDNPRLDRNELSGETTSVITGAPALNPYPHSQYQEVTHENANELAGTAASPIIAAELSDNDRWSYPQELGNEIRSLHVHELGSGNATRSQSLYSDNQTLTNEQGDRDEHLEMLKAKRAAVAEERERLRRMEMLREEDERLEREIAEYEKRNGY